MRLYFNSNMYQFGIVKGSIIIEDDQVLEVNNTVTIKIIYEGFFNYGKEVTYNTEIISIDNNIISLKANTETGTLNCKFNKVTLEGVYNLTNPIDNGIIKSGSNIRYCNIL